MKSITNEECRDMVLGMAFHQAILAIDRRARYEAGLKGNSLTQMILRYGGLEAAKRLLQPSSQFRIHAGLVDLWTLGRVDLSVEALAVQSPHRPLFASELLLEAERRLKQCDYTFLTPA
ncbi:hypothetical protein EN925_15040 [Mesorhizobium sp. M7A.F.Ca.US.006.04.2.1]|uniref:hypothetical protein n=1 Tax=unclassified Mesorhizobium TaxID=325217 RepID=UPI000FCAEB5E|nr:MULTISPECIES: hypothetical protein [unclassified Mesorhizobium]RUX73900.1 hypothetical protein EN990_19690 [Mesorhizobium sp. M7A.F.Ca.US.005.03.1.1]RUY18464.1 hypothetical protein EN991_04110 [Mesorhizobium sp. M7A.F.Ca.US.005.03.2.1]RVA90402.1 hypothetical protein EN925_15040 [Mesorhizobium sp. M7A.F.Ca.US.006.04.2.1]